MSLRVLHDPKSPIYSGFHKKGKLKEYLAVKLHARRVRMKQEAKFLQPQNYDTYPRSIRTPNIVGNHDTSKES